MAFRTSVRRALAAPLGGPLRTRFTAPRITALVADGQADERVQMALAELADALVGVGLPRGRMFTLLTGGGPAGVTPRERARELHDTLGMPVLVHDPAASAHTRAGVLADGTVLELDDELREAEAVVIVGRYGTDARQAVRGGPNALLPGLASAACAAASAPPANLAWPDKVLWASERGREAASQMECDFALLWSDDDPPQVMAGAGVEVFAACIAAGWLRRQPGHVA